MSLAATIPFTAPRSATQPWTPSDRDRLIFQWVKFEGHKQSWVAEQLGINQSTVSRTVERYERWIARGGPGMQGSPSHDERLRSQRWLTYERNEWLLASALRLAGEMERALDTSKSNITRHASEPARDIEVRTEHKVLDRSGTACRYLRLAHRINMDQLELVEQDPLPPLEPLSVEESGDTIDCHGHSAQGCHGHPARAEQEIDAPSLSEPSNVPDEVAEPCDQTFPAAPADALSISMQNDLPVTSVQLSPSTTPMHHVHNLEPSKTNATHDAPTNSEEIPLGKKLRSLHTR